ncbi:MAG: CCA tRNA nucleotidyltransferase [Oligoflexales bacterium]|nr:CCA tRNA nucleotidyltransferase [Oligoflexales bacterium]
MQNKNERLYEGAVELIDILENSGYQARLAGGCVRDRYMKRDPSDYDIATDALPEAICSIFKASRMKVVPTGIEHGTVTVVSKKGCFEVTSLRRDVETDGRHAVVEFGTSFEEDAARRDFTINAMFEDKDGRIFDYFGGIRDINEGVLRFVGNPSIRIREDYLRILRFFRFWVRFSLRPDFEALSAIRSEGQGLKKVSQERITSEIMLLLELDDPGDALDKMIETGIWELVFPEFDRKDFSREKITGLKKIENSFRPLCRIFSMISPEMGIRAVHAIGSRLKLSNQNTEKIKTLLWGKQNLPEKTDDVTEVMEYLDRCDEGCWEGRFLDVILPTLRTLFPEDDERLSFVEGIENNYSWLRKANMPIDGKVLIKDLSLSEGAEIGRILLFLKKQFRREAWKTKEEGLRLASDLLSGKIQG